MSNIFVDAKLSLRKKDLVPLTEETIKPFSGLKSSYSEIKEYLIENNLSIENLFTTRKGLNHFWYVEGYVFIPLYSIDVEFLEFSQLVERVKVQKEELNSSWLEGDYDSFFCYVEKQFLFEVYFELFDELPKNQLYPLFLDIYLRSDYGFHDLEPEKVKEIFTLNKGTVGYSPFEIDKEGYVTIYRGMQSLSTPVDKAYSWTTNISTAIKFAVKHNSVDAKVYIAKIHYSDIVDYVTQLLEYEVLVIPEDLKDVRPLPFLTFSKDFRDVLSEVGVVKTYQHFAHYVLSPKWFKNPTGIHGTLHIKRVLMLSLIMSYIDELPYEDKLILLYASLYHDIGRTHDNADKHHGSKSVEKRRSLNLEVDGLTKDDIVILEFIMKYHAMHDEVGYRDLERNKKIKDKDRALDLFKRFKDCDNLDRVRIGDLDLNYLRTKTGKNLILVAHQLLLNIK